MTGKITIIKNILVGNRSWNFWAKVNKIKFEQFIYSNTKF